MHYPVVIFIMIYDLKSAIAEVLFAKVAVGVIPVVDNRISFYLKQL